MVRMTIRMTIRSTLQEYEQMMEELRDKYEREQRSHAMLQQELTALRVQYEQQMQQLKVTHSSSPDIEQLSDNRIPTQSAVESSRQQGTSTHAKNVSNESAVAVTEPNRSPPKPEMELNNALKRHS